MKSSKWIAIMIVIMIAQLFVWLECITQHADKLQQINNRNAEFAVALRSINDRLEQTTIVCDRMVKLLNNIDDQNIATLKALHKTIKQERMAVLNKYNKFNMDASDSFDHSIKKLTKEEYMAITGKSMPTGGCGDGRVIRLPPIGLFPSGVE